MSAYEHRRQRRLDRAPHEARSYRPREDSPRSARTYGWPIVASAAGPILALRQTWPSAVILERTIS